MGKKYIIEKDDNESIWSIYADANGDATIEYVSLTPYTEPDLEQVREEAYDKCMDEAEMSAYKLYSPKIDEAYQRGLSDAWDAARKIYLPIEYGGIPADVLRQMFDNKSASGIFKKVSAFEAVEKIRQYEQEKEDQIKVGDEVIPRETEYDDMIVTRLWKDDYDSDCIDAIGFDGRIGSFLVSRVSKTGKHYEIAEVLQKMKEA